MADSSVIITGIADGALEQGLGDLPPWATESTLEDIHGLLMKTYDIDVNISKTLLALSKSSLDPEKFKELNSELDKILKNFDEQLDRNKKKRKDDEEDRDHHLKSTKLWKFLNDSQYRFNQLLVLSVTSFKLMKDAIVDNVKTFDHLYSSGIAVTTASDSAANAFDSLRNMSLLAGMSVAQFGKILEASAGANALGAVRFAKTLPIVSKNLQAFGFDVNQAAQVTGAYLDTISGFASVQSKSQSEIEEGATAYGKSLARLSLVTGISRQKLLENTAAIAANTDANVIAATNGTDAATKFSAFAASFKDPNIGNQFLKMMSSKLPALNSTFQNFAKAGLGNLGMQIVRFTKSLAGLSPEKAALATKNFVNSLGNLDPIINQQQLLAEAGVEGAEENLKLLTGLRQQANQAKDLNDADLEKNEKSAAAAAKIRSAWMGIMATFSNLFAPTLGELETFGKVLSSINVGLQHISSWANNTHPFESFNASVADMTKYVIAAAAGFMLVWKSLSVFKLMKGGSSLIGSGSGGAGKVAGSFGEGAGKGISGLFGGIGEGISKLGAGIGQGTGKLIEGLFKGIATGLTFMADPLILVGASILAGSIILIGGAIAGATWLVGAALPEFSKGLKTFSDIDGSNLVNVAKGIGALSAAMAAFGAGSVIGSVGNVVGTIAGGFSKLFGDGSMIDQLKVFSSIGPGIMSAATGINLMAAGLNNLSSALKSFSDVGKLRDIVGSLNGRINTDQNFVSAQKNPQSSTINSPSATPADPSRVKSNSVSKTDESYNSGVGIEKPSSSGDINNVLAYQSSLLEQILIALNSTLSVNKDILKYSKNH